MKCVKNNKFTNNKILLGLAISLFSGLGGICVGTPTMIDKVESLLAKIKKMATTSDINIAWDELLKRPEHTVLVKTINNLRGGRRGKIKSVLIPATYFEPLTSTANITLNIDDPHYSLDIPLKKVKYEDLTAAEKSVFDYFKFDKNSSIRIIGFVPKMIQTPDGPQQLINGSFSTGDYSKISYLNWSHQNAPYDKYYIENPSLFWIDDTTEFNSMQTSKRIDY